MIFTTLSLAIRPSKDRDQLAARSRRRKGNRRFRAEYAAKWPQRQAKDRRLAAVNHIYLKLQIVVAVTAIQTGNAISARRR